MEHWNNSTPRTPHFSLLFVFIYIYVQLVSQHLHSPSYLLLYHLKPLKMAELQVGDSFPDGVAFSYAPLTKENSEITSCGLPQKFNASEGT